MTTLTQVAARLRGEGGLLAAAVTDPPAEAPPGDAPIESIREGYLLHYAQPRIVATEDPDLALLAGDRLYALGLADLADRGDLGAVRTMADVIARAAAAHAAGDEAAARAAWSAAPPYEPPAAGAR